MQVAFLRQHAAHVAYDRFDDDGCDVCAVFVENLFESRRVVVRNCDGVLRNGNRNAGTVGQAECCDA